LNRARAKLVGQPKPMPVVIGLALIIMAISFAGGFKTSRMAVWSYSQKVNQPTWWLCRQLPGADRQRVMWELQRRLDESEFAPRQAEAVGKAMLDVQEQSPAGFGRDLAEFVQALRTKGRLSDDQWRRYAAHAVQFYKCECRGVVRRGDPMPFKFTFGEGNLVYNPALSYTYRLQRVEVNGAAVPLQNTPLSELRSTIPEQATGYDQYPPIHLIAPDMLGSSKLIEGPQTLKLAFAITVYDGNEARAESTPLVTYELARQFNWTLVAADAQTVETVRSKEWEDALRRTVGPVRIFALADGSGGADVTLGLQVSYREVPVAMSIELRAGERSWTFAHISSDTCPPFVYQVDLHLDRFATDHVDVFLRGDADEARRTPDILRIWDGEIAFRDVPVHSWDGPRQPLRPPSKRMGYLAD
jgi:hypothetical protein